MAEADGAYARASSISAAVPEALSFAPGPVPLSSRWAIRTIVFCDRPALAATRFSSCSVPRPGTVAVNRSVWTWKPYEVSCVANQRAAFVAPAVPGIRLG